MLKNNIFEIQGQVIKLLPNTMFIVKINDKYQIIAYISGKMRKNHVKILIGDKVTVEISQYDITKGRISQRHE